MRISIIKRLYYFIRLGRPLFLLGGALFHALGISIAVYHGAALSLPALIWGQVAITSIQVMTHYGNEYFDLETDHANPTPTFWAGGSRILVEGFFPPRVALFTSLAAMGAALVAVFVLISFVQVGSLSVLLVLLALFLAWEYSAPPLRLHSRGLGEFTVGVIVPFLTPLVGYTLQSGDLTALPILSVVPLFCLQIAMALSINVPDAVGDRQSGKRTAVIRLGAPRAMALYVVMLIVVYLSLPVLMLLGVPATVTLVSSIPLPLAVYQIFRVLRGDWREPAQWNSLGFWSIALLIVTALFQTIAYLWLIYF